MDFDYRKGGLSTAGRQQTVNYDNSRSSSMFGPRFDRSGTVPAPQSQPYYPRIAQPVGPPVNRPPPPIPSNSSSSNLPTTGIRVAIKPEYRVGPAVQLILPQNAEVPRSLFNFDFELERRILAEAEREAQGWDPAKANGDSNFTPGMAEDPIVNKYLAMGLHKEAVVMAVAIYGDVQNKVLEFVPAYNLLREMGFPAVAVAGALAMYDNDRERALAHFV
ncbi:hypothetical protein R1sor_002772 [Riccia sorocarpa]|uniref:Uncharacterized protein n=1 Tax=Riccia sorocarpa TaxID=122646 RepID=A0ABD3GZQ2_9MARC